MSLSVTLKSYLATSLYATGYTTARLDAIPSDRFSILMYHRVLPRVRTNDSTQAGMYVTPGTFELHLQFLQRHFDIVSLSRLFSGGQRAQESSMRRPLCALTFDDGWADFRELAFPVLQAHGIPALVYLPTDYIGTMRWFWTDRIAFILKQFDQRDRREAKGKRQASSIVRQLEEIMQNHGDGLDSAIELLKKYRNEEIEETLAELSCRWDLSSNPPGRAFLTWEEVSEMARSGLVSYGSHTASHRILTTLSDAEIEDELHRSMQELLSRSVVESSTIPFSYPNGDFNSRIAEMVKDAGYRSAVVTRPGWNSSASDPFALLRVGVHQDMTSSEAMLACRLLEIF